MGLLGGHDAVVQDWWEQHDFVKLKKLQLKLLMLSLNREWKSF